MPADLTTKASGGVPALPTPIVEAARRFSEASRARSTREKYAAAWEDFSAWCAMHGRPNLPAHAGTVAGYLSVEAARGMSPSWIQIKLSAIGWFHRRFGYQPPQRTEHGAIITEILAGIRREHGAPAKKKAAADADVCRDVLHSIRGDDLRSIRDRALVSFGMASCMRRSELSDLLVSDIVRVPEGIRITIRKSKGDQESKGVEIAVPEGRRLRPVAHLEAWMAAGSISDGFLFRRISNDGKKVTTDGMSDRSIALVVKARAAAAGLDPDAFSGHSLRAGFLTAAARSGASIFAMQAQSRHKSINVLSGYVRSAKLFQDHAGKEFL
jgi:integrase